MAGVLFRLRAEARSRWRAWLGLAIMAGLVAGGAIAALAGARRTETAYERFHDGTRGFDVLVTNGGTPETLNRQFDFDQVAHLPDVSESARIAFYFPDGRTPSGRTIGSADITPFASLDGRFGTSLNRFHVLHGRVARGQREITVSFTAADRLDLHVGDVLRMRLVGPTYAANFENLRTAPVVPFRVAGVVAVQGAFPPLPRSGVPPMVFPSTAYARAHPDFGQVLAVRLRHGSAGIHAFERQLDRLARGTQVTTLSTSDTQPTVQRSLEVDATALRVLAVVVAGVGMLLLAQALVRRAFLDSTDHAVLRAMGLTQSQLDGLGIARALLLALGTAVVAAVTAVALSPLTPVGVARKAELHPGAALNVAYIGIGVVAVVLLMVALGAVPALARRPPGTAAGRRTSVPSGVGVGPDRLLGHGSVGRAHGPRAGTGPDCGAGALDDGGRGVGGGDAGRRVQLHREPWPPLRPPPALRVELGRAAR